MNCIYCGQQTENFTTTDEPICWQCANAKGFPVCTELGKFVADASFSCDQDCADCAFMERE